MIQQFKEENFKHEYGIRCHRFYPKAEYPTPFGSSWCQIEPDGSTAPHSHHEGETFFIMEGEGTMKINDDESQVRMGDVVYIPGHSQHVLTNNSSTAPVRFLSVWWEAKAEEVKVPTQSFITVAPPTPNGDLHLGHLSGPYIASDVYNRFLKMNGASTFFLSGSDDNQSYVPAKGRKMALTAQEVVDLYSESILATLGEASVQLDAFLRPTKNQEYRSFVQAFFQKLVANGKLVEKQADSLYCHHCQLFLHEAYVSGKCPHCSAATNGHGCESCGITNDAINLNDPRCNQCNNVPERRPLRKFYFPLAAYREKLQTYYQTVSMSPRLRAFTERNLREGLADVSASFTADWGIPVPVPDFGRQVIYEWVEMAAGYAFMAGQIEGHRGWNALTRQPGRQFAQFFGFDNSFFYTSLIPALLMAYDPELQLPTVFVSNEFYRLEGLKFSTSRNHAVWAHEILETVPADVVRYYLSYSRPESEQTNFTLEEFQVTVERELVRNWETWLVELDERLGLIDRISPSYRLEKSEHIAFHIELRRLTQAMHHHFQAETFCLNHATKLLGELVTLSRHFAKSQSFLRESPENRKTWLAAVGLELTALRTLALLAAPLLPDFSRRLRLALGEDGQPVWDSDATLFPGTRKIEPLQNGEFARALQQIESFREGKRA